VRWGLSYDEICAVMGWSYTKVWAYPGRSSRRSGRGSGAHAVLLVDTLDGVPPAAARRALAAARAIVDGGSLTIIATATEPIGGETTVIGLDATRTAARNFPALDLTASGTLRPELLVGNAGPTQIAAAPTRPSDIRVAAGSRRCAR
jgi:hypothetical protein